uniref:OV-16 antigen n=2 Tax=Cacopsylla melanoneura TaxID=428564 RepID=A0A8D9B510_9HEMI
MSCSPARLCLTLFVISVAMETLLLAKETTSRPRETTTEEERLEVPYYPYREPKMKEHGIVPHVVPHMPEQIFWAMYKKKGAKQQNVLLGHRIRPHEAQVVPEVHWDAGWNQSIYFTMMMVDPDHYGRNNPMHDQYCHWLVVNIPGDNMTVAQTIAPYEPPAPANGTGLHRYLFLVYVQPQGRVTCDEMQDKRFNREHFSATRFAAKYHFNKGIESANFFQSEHYDWSKHVNVTEDSDEEEDIYTTRTYFSSFHG